MSLWQCLPMYLETYLVVLKTNEKIDLCLQMQIILYYEYYL